MKVKIETKTVKFIYCPYCNKFLGLVDDNDILLMISRECEHFVWWSFYEKEFEEETNEYAKMAKRNAVFVAKTDTDLVYVLLPIEAVQSVQ